MKILITGGTGSLGHKLVDSLLVNSNYEIIIVSRDEQKQFLFSIEYERFIASGKIKMVLGDIRDRDFIFAVIGRHKPDVVINAAAQKHVFACENNAWQAILTNINGTNNIIDACCYNSVKCCCQISTDKAFEPTTIYGMTKFIAENLILKASLSLKTTKFCGVRYGNVVNSNGSLLTLYSNIAKSNNKIFPVTDINMTRFWITFNNAIALIYKSINSVLPEFDVRHIVDGVEYNQNEILDTGIFLVPKLYSSRIIDVANIFISRFGGEIKIIGASQNEKIHESMVSGYSSDMFLMDNVSLEQLLLTEGCFK